MDGFNWFYVILAGGCALSWSVKREQHQTVLKLAALVCPHCGEAFGPGASARSLSDLKERQEEWRRNSYGRRLGRVIWSWTVRCPSCGWISSFDPDAGILHSNAPTRTVRNCDFPARGEYCPGNWDALGEMGQADARWCAVCRRAVFWCDSDEQTMRHAERGERIARDTHFLQSTRPGGADESRAEQEERYLTQEREYDINGALSDLKHTARRCPRCAYPVPEWRKTCRVCGHRVREPKPDAN